MVKSREDTIADFNEQINMTAEELEAWLENPMSTKAGTGVGLESAAKIIEILKKNPTKDPNKYDDEDIEHMRKVAGYNKRHIAQEEHLKDTKTKEELEKAKSTISLKNWGHDPLKTLNGDDAPAVNNEKAEAEKEETPAESEEHASSKIGSKRKHDDAATTDGQEPGRTGEDAVDEGDQDAEGEEHSSEDGEEETKGRMRKKSKTETKKDA